MVFKVIVFSFYLGLVFGFELLLCGCSSFIFGFGCVNVKLKFFHVKFFVRAHFFIHSRFTHDFALFLRFRPKNNLGTSENTSFRVKNQLHLASVLGVFEVPYCGVYVINR